jgi:hypothetical protein
MGGCKALEEAIGASLDIIPLYPVLEPNPHCAYLFVRIEEIAYACCPFLIL